MTPFKNRKQRFARHDIFSLAFVDRMRRRERNKRDERLKLMDRKWGGQTVVRWEEWMSWIKNCPRLPRRNATVNDSEYNFWIEFFYPIIFLSIIVYLTRQTFYSIHSNCSFSKYRLIRLSNFKKTIRSIERHRVFQLKETFAHWPHLHPDNVISLFSFHLSFIREIEINISWNKIVLFIFIKRVSE